MTQYQITKEMTIADALQVKPAIADILLSKGMHCLGCSIAHGETIEQAAQVHGLDIKQLIMDLNGVADIEEN